MSEFTEGILFLNSDMAKLIKAAEQFKQPKFVRKLDKDWQQRFANATDKYQFAEKTDLDYIIHPINKKWSALLLEQYVLGNRSKPVLDWLKRTSKQLPLLVFEDSEVVGWSYQLFDAGKSVAEINVNYELEFGLVVEYLRQKYPQHAHDIMLLLESEDVTPLYKQIANSQEYKQIVSAMYQNKNVEQFTVFGLSDDEIEKLNKEVSSEVYEESVEAMMSQVEQFKKIIGILAVHYMNYEYHSRDES